ncbi:MAG: phage portal protein [Geminicoccaceae bacterium]
MAPRLVERMPQRQANFEGALGRRRMSAYNPTREHVNGLLALQGPRLLARTRDLARNNPYIFSARDSFMANAVGAGIVPSWLDVTPRQKSKLEKAWLTWTDEADYDGVCDLYGLQALVAAALFEAGECFVRLLRSEGPSGTLQLRLIESEQCPVDLTRPAANGHQIRSGIEFDATGRRVAYWFYRHHPGDSTESWKSADHIRLPADEILHLYRPTRAGQIRGAPWIAAAVVKAFMLDKYDDAELDRKGTAALFAGFITTPVRGGASPLAGAKGELDSPGVAIAGMQPGTMQILEPGEDIKFSEPADVGGQYESFEYRTILQLCAATGTPYTNVTGDLKAANYSSLRAGMLEYRRRLEQLQHNTLVFQFCRPVAAVWVKQAALSGELNLPAIRTDLRRYTSIKWIPPRFEWVDPLKDRKAEEVAVANGWKSRSDVIEAEGYDAEQVDARIAADQERAKRYGIGPFPRPAKAAAPTDPNADELGLDPSGPTPTDPAQEDAA